MLRRTVAQFGLFYPSASSPKAHKRFSGRAVGPLMRPIRHEPAIAKHKAISRYRELLMCYILLLLLLWHSLKIYYSEQLREDANNSFQCRYYDQVVGWSIYYVEG